MPPKKGKKLILIRDDLLEEVIKLTAREGKTVFAFTNEVFEDAVKSYEAKTNPKELLEFYTLMKLEKDRGTVNVSIELLNSLIQKSYETDKEDLLQEWYDSGLWFGKYLSMKSQAENWLPTFEKLMKVCAWNMIDFSITAQGDNISIKCVSPHFTKETTEAFRKFLEGTIHSGNYKTLKNDCLKGLIALSFKKQEQAGKEC